ncbi:hypothetical protein Goarm_017032 [Gossypium armourianum]|uniref:Uncharacterized protein n=1 Tax=Gossypium armourianum TaxID=34283 RepID=A0A7J9JE35_9ROSI|nr:hypothetical protein [Gossypium armourianum]
MRNGVPYWVLMLKSILMQLVIKVW